MNNILLAFFVFLIVPEGLIAQTMPREGDTLRYRIIGFSFPEEKNATGYLLEIARGDHHTNESFKKNIIYTQETRTNRIIAEVPSFGAQYTWRVIMRGNDPVSSQQKFNHFSTMVLDENMNTSRLRIINKAEKYKDAYIFLDQARALYNMNGEAVWFLPSADKLGYSKVPVRDIKMSPQGTITFIAEGHDAFEINYNGDLLWKGPDDGVVNGGKKEHYHHEFTKLKNGHYMILGNAPAQWQPPKSKPDSSINVAMIDSAKRRAMGDTAKRRAMARQNMMTPFGTIIEYDEDGKVVWSWKSSKYFLESDVYKYTDMGGRRIADVHLNSFYFDEKEKVVYAGFKNISRILKIKYPEGNVLNAYGEVYQQGIPEKGNGLFCYQHACKRSSDGYVYLFNNNSCVPDCYPEILLLQEPNDASGTLKKVWGYPCPVRSLREKLEGKITGKGEGTTGGNVMELPDQSFFVSVCSPYSQVFIVDRNKKILWSAEPEKWNPTKAIFTSFPQYRASIITSKEELEKLVWGPGSAK